MTIGLPNQCFNAPPFVKGRIEANEDTPGRELRQELLFQPNFKHLAIAVSLIGYRCDELVLMPSGHKTDSLGAMATAFSRESFAFQTPTVSIIFGVVDARFV